MAPVPKKDDRLPSCCPPSIPILCYLTPINDSHLSYIVTSRGCRWYNQVSSHCDQRVVLRWWQASAREFWCTIFDMNLADAGNHLVWQFGRYLCRLRADQNRLRLHSNGDGKSAGQSRLLLLRKDGQIHTTYCDQHFQPEVFLICLGLEANTRMQFKDGTGLTYAVPVTRNSTKYHPHGLQS